MSEIKDIYKGKLMDVWEDGELVTISINQKCKQKKH